MTIENEVAILASLVLFLDAGLILGLWWARIR